MLLRIYFKFHVLTKHMNDLVAHVNKLKKSKVKGHIETRLHEFIEAGKGSNEDLFSELCYCLLTANFVAEKAMKIQKELGNGFLTLPENDLEARLRELGHRFPLARAKYIVEARQHKNKLKRLLATLNEHEMRKWLIGNVRGLGLKEASHFLRNVGATDVAIIDFHIVDILVKYCAIEKPKTLTPKRYMDIEEMLRSLAVRTGTTLAELDLYLWFAETGKLLK